MKTRLLKAGAQSGSIMVVADVSTQVIIERKYFNLNSIFKVENIQRQYDPYRSLRWASAGFILHGPYFFYTFSRMDRWLGTQQTIRNALRKTAIAQFAIFPPYLCAIFAYMGALERSSDITQHVMNKVPNAFLVGCIFWPVANIINFAFIPSTTRVPYLAAVGSIWNSFLSWINSTKKDDL